jgi:glucan 1,3-beta-glucosidase
VPIESLGLGGWLRSLSFAALAITAPVAGAAALAARRGVPTFAQVIGPKARRTRDPLEWVLGLFLIALTVLAAQSALAHAFDPRYRDFPFAPLTAAAVPFVLLSWIAPRPAGARPRAETLAAAALVLSAAFVVWNETLANWQALWFGAGLALVAVSLVRARAAPG